MEVDSHIQYGANEMSEKITVTYEIPAPPEGWEYAGVREVRKGELYFNGKGWVLWDCDLYVDAATPVAVRKQQWRPATEADIGREDARFFDHRHHPYCTGKLLHMGSGNFVALSNGKSGELYKKDHASNWEYCEVPVT